MAEPEQAADDVRVDFYKDGARTIDLMRGRTAYVEKSGAGAQLPHIAATDSHAGKRWVVAIVTCSGPKPDEATLRAIAAKNGFDTAPFLIGVAAQTPELLVMWQCSAGDRHKPKRLQLDDGMHSVELKAILKASAQSLKVIQTIAAIKGICGHYVLFWWVWWLRLAWCHFGVILV